MISEINPNAQAYFAYRAINYLGGEPLEKEFSLIGSAKEAVKSTPLIVGLSEGPRAAGFLLNGGLKKGYQGLHSTLKATAQDASMTRASANIFKKGSLKNWLQNFEIINDVANPKNVAGAVKEPGFFGKIFNVIKKPFALIKKPFAAGAKALGNVPFGKTTLGQTTLGKLCKKSNAGFIAAIDGVMETFTQVVPAFKNGGFKEGMKQLGKSTTKVVASTLGFVAGEAGGKAIGAAIGTAICPGIGTFIGGALGGFIGGMFGSSVAGGIAKKVTGKSYSEKAAEGEKQQMAQQVAQDSNSMQMLRSETLQRLNAKQQSGEALTTEEQELLQCLQTGQGSATTYTMPGGGYDYRTTAFKANQTGSFSAVA